MGAPITNSFELLQRLEGVEIPASGIQILKGPGAAAATRGFALGFHTDTTTGVAAKTNWCTGALLVVVGSGVDIYQNTGAGYGTAPTWSAA